MINYTAFNTEVFANVPLNASNILDVGCGTGILGKALKAQNNSRTVCGVTYSNEEYQIAKESLDSVVVADINKDKLQLEEMYDCMIFSHILEHTYEPEKVLANFSCYLKNEGVIVVALPNVLFFKQRFEFLKGKFQYSEHGGLMDVTHFRFFDWEAAKNLITKAGFKIVSKKAVGYFPMPLLRKAFPGIIRKLDNYSVRNWPGLFGFQFVFIAAKG